MRQQRVDCKFLSSHPMKKSTNLRSYTDYNSGMIDDLRYIQLSAAEARENNVSLSPGTATRHVVVHCHCTTAAATATCFSQPHCASAAVADHPRDFALWLDPCRDPADVISKVRN